MAEMKNVDYVRFYVQDEFVVGQTQLFREQTIESLLRRFGENPERVAAICLLAIANSKAMLPRRARTLNLTIDETAEDCRKQAAVFEKLAEMTTGGGMSHQRPLVTFQGETGRRIMDVKGIEGVGPGQIKDSEATATGDYSPTPSDS